ncbi:MAG: thymidine phosphorylase [Clostridia bacterium]|nr:thymidine phosphorylase [Clostridia bacterium]
MRMYDVIYKKRKGGELTEEEIRSFISGYVAGEIPDYQASALLMAICFNGMNEAETAILTDAVANSGDTVDLSRFGTLTADKHSTGGVGDKTSLIVAPLAASLGAVVTKMSGRGLGHTGGTVDKLESIPGYRTALSAEEFIAQAERVGIVVVGQSGNMTPADKKLYALRDVTATVDCIPLMVSSIMGKKLAAGSHSIVLDVKVGSGAFMKTPEDAEELAREMVKIGKRCGRNVAALLTDMDTPLGCAVGNALEIKEAVSVLRGETRGPLREICVALAANMVSLALELPIDEALSRAEASLDSGAAFAKMKEWIAAQGGDVAYIEDTSRFPQAPGVFNVVSDRAGFVTAIDALKIGLASVLLGAGRASKDEEIDHSAGVVLRKTVGDSVAAGETLCTLYTAREDALRQATEDVRAAFAIADTRPEKRPLIYKTVR